MVAQNSIDRTGGWSVQKNQAAQAQEEPRDTYAFPSTAPKPSSKFSIAQPSIPNDLSKVVADLKHGSPDQSGLYTAYAGKPLKVKTTPFNNKIKGDPEKQYNQPVPNMKGDDLLPADDGTPLRPSATLKRMGEAAKLLADDPNNAARRAELIRMYNDIMRIFYISERRPLNNDEISRVEEYARIIDRLLLQGPVRPPPQRDIINQDLLDRLPQPDIINQDMLDRLGEPVEPVEDGKDEEDGEDVAGLEHFGDQLRIIYHNEDPDDEEVELVEVDDYKHNVPIETLGSLGSSLGTMSTQGSSLGTMSTYDIPTINTLTYSPLGSSLRTISFPGSVGSPSSSLSSTLSSIPSSSLRLSYSGFDKPLSMSDAPETRNPMAGATYTVEEKKIDTPQVPTVEEKKIDTPQVPTEEIPQVPTVEDRNIMFNALNLIKQRFNLGGRTKNEILAEIRSRPNTDAAKSLSALQRFAQDQPGERSKGQEQWMRKYLKTKYPQRETRGRPRLER